MLEGILGFPASRLRILQAMTLQKLKNHLTLREVPFPPEGPTLVVSYGFGSSAEYYVEPAKGVVTDARVKDLIYSVQQGLNNPKTNPGKTDELDCTGGVYFMKSSHGGIVGVFKPQDEEQGMENNPKGHAGNGTHGLRPHFSPGDGFIREYAAYLLDDENFCKVPTTTIASCEHPSFNYAKNRHDKKVTTFPKVGSLQRYVRANDTFEDISPSLLSTFEVQKIAMLDLRLLNCDRNSANILAIRKDYASQMADRRNSRGESLSSMGDLNEMEIDMLDFIGGQSGFKGNDRSSDSYELIPIDHGYALPTHLQIDEYDWAWYYSPQVTQPVHPLIRAYLNRLNFDELIEKVCAQVQLAEDTVFLLRIAHELLVQGVNAGLTLFDIANLVARTCDGVPSPLEKLIARAEENANSAIEVREGHRFSKMVAFSNGHSPARRGKSPSKILASTPPRAEELLYIKRMVKSELFKDNNSDDEVLRPSFGRDRVHSEDISSSAKASLKSLRNDVPDDDYFVTDLAESPGLPPQATQKLTLPKASVSSPFAFPLPGEELRTMKTLDSSGLTFLFGSKPTNTTVVSSHTTTKSTQVTAFSTSVSATSTRPSSTVSNSSAPLQASSSSSQPLPKFSSGEPSPLNKKAPESYGDYFEGLTASEASSYESAGQSPRNFLDTTSNAPNIYPTFGAPLPQSFKPSTTNTTVGDIVKPKPTGNGDISCDTMHDCDHLESHGGSFEALEVQTMQPMIFDKVSNCRGVSSEMESYDSSGDVESVRDCSSVSSTPSEAMFEQLMALHLTSKSDAPSTEVKAKSVPAFRQRDMQANTSADNLDFIPMARVTSFNALESPPLYQVDQEGKPHRLMRHLRREKRKQSSQSMDFPLLRLHFAQLAVKKMVASARMAALDSY